MKPLTKILVVDDDEDLLRIVEYCFARMPSILLRCAHDGESALKVALEMDPDLILLDVMMVPMDGVAAFKALKLIPKLAKAPVVFLTAKAQKKEIEEYFHMGAADVIIKPFDPLTLPEVVMKIWERFQK